MTWSIYQDSADNFLLGQSFTFKCSSGCSASIFILRRPIRWQCYASIAFRCVIPLVFMSSLLRVSIASRLEMKKRSWYVSYWKKANMDLLFLPKPWHKSGKRSFLGLEYLRSLPCLAWSPMPQIWSLLIQGLVVLNERPWIDVEILMLSVDPQGIGVSRWGIRMFKTFSDAKDRKWN